MLKLQKTSRTYKYFGKSFYEVWANTFHDYTIILVFLLSKETPDLHFALAKFYNNVYKLSTVYKWQKAVFPIAIEAHIFIVAQQPTDLAKWVISEKFQGRFCIARTMIRMGLIMGAEVKKKRSRSPMGACHNKLSESNNPLISYELFNKGGCDWPLCNRAHKCKECRSKDYGQLECTVKGKKTS